MFLGMRYYQWLTGWKENGKFVFTPGIYLICQGEDRILVDEEQM